MIGMLVSRSSCKWSDRVQPRSRAGIAGDENQIAFFRARGRPFEKAPRMHRLIVFIDPHQRHVDIEARES